MPMRVSKADEEMGLDASLHDEKYLQGTLLVKNNEISLEPDKSIHDRTDF